MESATFAERSRSRRRCSGLFLGGLALAFLATPAAAQSGSRLVVKGLQDVERWETDWASGVVAGGEGSPGPGGGAGCGSLPISPAGSRASSWEGRRAEKELRAARTT